MCDPLVQIVKMIKIISQNGKTTDYSLFLTTQFNFLFKISFIRAAVTLSLWIEPKTDVNVTSDIFTINYITSTINFVFKYETLKLNHRHNLLTRVLPALPHQQRQTQSHISWTDGLLVK